MPHCRGHARPIEILGARGNLPTHSALLHLGPVRHVPPTDRVHEAELEGPDGGENIYRVAASWASHAPEQAPQGDQVLELPPVLPQIVLLLRHEVGVLVAAVGGCGEQSQDLELGARVRDEAPEDLPAQAGGVDGGYLDIEPGEMCEEGWSTLPASH
ncbi:unnamed protein product [Clonostachys solani]|uniref:Uncharacterized protein n=1 Tax=Clonostachys solani TaxID=160281 RepID=A0A9N9ZDE9_9HYPO|nr:unnamed protein product [Clonostachys solani]